MLGHAPDLLRATGARRHGHGTGYQEELNHASCRNFTFRGLGRVDEVEDEDSHNKGAEGVEQ